MLSRLPTEANGLVRLASQLRAKLGVVRSHLLLEQIELRQRGREKFTRAAEMFFTRVGLEQSTDEVVARYKAGRFPDGVPLADLCCGIGGDLMALAERGPVVGVDANPAVALLAEANCRHLVSMTAVAVQTNDVEHFELAGIEAWHIDPDRRPKGRRTTRVEAYQPGPATLQRLRGQCPSCAIKLAPAAEVPAAWSDDSELEWISRRGQCRQLVAWFGQLARWPGARAATILRHDGVAPRTVHGVPTIEAPLDAHIGRFVFEPDPAVLAAGLSGALAEQHELHQFEPDICYLTGDRPIDDAAMASFAVLDVLPLDIKKLRRYLQDRRIGHLEVKKRGVIPDPDVIRRQLVGSCQGDQRLVLLLTRIAGRSVAIAARREGATEV